MTKQKHCPFCKSKHTMTWHIGGYHDKPWLVECMDCSASGPLAGTEKEAIKLWYKRVKE